MNTLALFVLTACVCKVYTAEIYDLNYAEVLFNNFVQDYNKKYKDWIEKETRLQNFKKNLMKYNERNMNSELGEAEFGIDRFSDLTTEEFVQQFTGVRFVGDRYDSCSTIKRDKDIPTVNTPLSFDWRAMNAVTRVKDQANCSSCWAFSAVGNLEGQNAIKHKTLLEFSEQQLVDCDKNCLGCSGGLMSTAFKYLMKSGGAESEAAYPYTGLDDTCVFNLKKVKAKVTGCVTYNLTSQNVVKQLLYKTGPISIAITADELQGYKKGIVSAATCGTAVVDHGVLLVGYGQEGGKPYWIIKNSWGKGFGENGYFRMERKEGVNTCMFLNQIMASAIVA